MQRLENEVAQGKAERAELRRRLELFEKIAAAAGAQLDDPALKDLDDPALTDTAPIGTGLNGTGPNGTGPNGTGPNGTGLNGTGTDSAAAESVPASLFTAARDPRRQASVRLDVDGRELIAVVGGDGGDPREWWTAIRRLAARLRNAS
jgi:hypothetical protein